jgi:hypothetical protein
MGMVAPRAHQSGRTTSANSPSTVKEIQKILRSILWIVSLPATHDRCWRKLACCPLQSGFRLEFFHHTLNQLFGVGEVFHDELHIHDRLAGPALALAVDAVLPDEGHGVGDQVHGDSEASAGHAHADFEVLEFFLLFVEDGHGQIVTGDVGIILGETAIGIQHSAFSQTTLALNWLTADG